MDEATERGDLCTLLAIDATQFGRRVGRLFAFSREGDVLIG